MKSLAILIISAQVCLGQFVLSNPPPSVPLSWDASLTPGPLLYWIYSGFTPGAYIYKFNAGEGTNYVVMDLQPGKTYYFAATSQDPVTGQESIYFSNEINYTIPAPPLPPILHPVISLTIQSKSIGDAQWSDTATGLTTASQMNQVFRLKIATVTPVPLESAVSTKQTAIKKVPSPKAKAP